MKTKKMKPRGSRRINPTKRSIQVKGRWKSIELDPSLFSDEGMEGLVCFEELTNYRLVNSEKEAARAAKELEREKKKTAKKRKASQESGDGAALETMETPKKKDKKKNKKMKRDTVGEEEEEPAEEFTLEEALETQSEAVDESRGNSQQETVSKEWSSPFNPNLTKTKPFYIDNYNIVSVQMMYREARYDMWHDSSLGAKVLRLPYVHGVSMLILLPNKGVDYTAIDDEINADRFQRWTQNLEGTKVEVHPPKFKMEESYKLHKLLPDLGISTVFTNAANLTNLHRNRELKVSEVLHKAVIEVDETGTTAAAATTVGLIPYSLPPIFIANRPFFFFIYHEDTNALLFMGRVIDPTK